MSVYYLANPANKKAQKLVDNYGQPPLGPFVDSFWPFPLTGLAAFLSFMAFNSHHPGWGWAMAALAGIFLAWAIGVCEPRLRYRCRRFRKFVASGEIIEVPVVLRRVLQSGLHKVNSASDSRDERRALEMSFGEVVALTKTLQALSSVEGLDRENHRNQARLMKRRVADIVSIYHNECLAVAAGQQRERSLGNDWAREVLRAELDDE